MELVVECREGYRGMEIPCRFTIGGRQFEVSEVLDRWLGTLDRYFKVQTADGSRYILRHKNELGLWELTFYAGGEGREPVPPSHDSSLPSAAP